MSKSNVRPMIGKLFEGELNEVDEPQAQELKEFIESLDLSPLNKKVSELVGEDITFVPEGFKHRWDGGFYPLSCPTNLADKCGIMSSVFREVTVGSFNCSVSYDEKSNKPMYYVSIHFEYTQKDGGMNGFELLRASYIQGEDWKFRVV